MREKILGKFVSQRTFVDSFIDMNILTVGFISLNYFFTFLKTLTIALIRMMTFFIDFEFRMKVDVLQ